jgi:phospholipid/cholesterol/gamma-HCH transport system ATP-binding protein
LAVTTSETVRTEPLGEIPDPVISLRGVTKRFGSHTVLKDVTFDVPRGKISAVLGPSGTGKSVLLKNIIGLLRPEEGQIFVDGEPVVGIRHKDMLRIRRKFGVLFQDGALFGSMDLFDNIAFPLREHTKKDEKEIRTLVLEKAEMVGLVAHLPKLPGEISGGMRKRAGLARALILNPDIVFFDEPDSGLDPVRVAYLDELVKDVQRELGCTFFIITHNIESVKRTADYIGMLYRSSLVRFGPADEMFNSSRSLVKQFLAGSSVGPIGMDEMVDAAKGEADVAALMSESGAGVGVVVSSPAESAAEPLPTEPIAAAPFRADPPSDYPDPSASILFQPGPGQPVLYDRAVEVDVEVDAETPARRVRAPRQTPASAKPTRPRKTAAPRKSPPRSSAVRVIRATDEDGQTADNGDPALSEGEIRQLAEEDARFNGES